MHISTIKTHRIEVGESLDVLIGRYVTSLREGDVLAITSKIISLCQGRVVKKEGTDLAELIKQEADAILQVSRNPYNIVLTIKDGLLVPNAGIDASNGGDHYILYPTHIQQVASDLWLRLRAKFRLGHLGIVITDSHTTPMRRGVTGVALGWCGLKPLRSYIGTLDVYGNPLRVTQTNILDGLATAAVLMMGEGAEQTPLSLIRGITGVSFVDRPPTHLEETSICISMDDDLYGPLLNGGSWA